MYEYETGLWVIMKIYTHTHTRENGLYSDDLTNYFGHKSDAALMSISER